MMHDDSATAAPCQYRRAFQDTDSQGSGGGYQFFTSDQRECMDGHGFSQLSLFFLFSLLGCWPQVVGVNSLARATTVWDGSRGGSLPSFSQLNIKYLVVVTSPFSLPTSSRVQRSRICKNNHDGRADRTD